MKSVDLFLNKQFEAMSLTSCNFLGHPKMIKHFSEVIQVTNFEVTATALAF